MSGFDFETYSEAGFIWNDATQKWEAPAGGSSRSKGLTAVGSAVYAQHPSTEVLTLTYKLDGARHRWKPGDPPPQILFDYLARGGTLHAHNAMFEYMIWTFVCVPKYGWPPLNPYQLRCSMATAHVNSLPGALANLSDVLQLPTPKDADGKRLLKKFSMPRDPTKKDPRRRITPADDPEDGERLYGYCDTDVDAEEGATQRMAPMTPDELLFWWVDQEINFRGIGVDRQGIQDCIAVMRQALDRYNDQCRAITGFDSTQLAKLQGWLSAQGVTMPSMDSEAIEAALKLDLPPSARQVLTARQLSGSASVKKLFAMENMVSRGDRLLNLIIHHKARTGRPGGADVQPLNLPKAGPKLAWCPSPGCSRPFKPSHVVCPWCGTPHDGTPATSWPGVPKDRPHAQPAIESVLAIMSHRSLDLVEWFFGDALLAISGCIRGLFVAAADHDLIATDYSSIEAVVIAMLAGEQWRIDAFRNKEPIYLLGASKITGRTVAEYLAYYEQHGEHHPDRQKIGKVSELAGGFGGWIGAWKAFGSEEDDATIKAQILAWRAASPAIVELWGGQFRGAPWDKNSRQEFFGYEGCAVQAILYPGYVFEYRGIKFHVEQTPAGRDALIITLLSGRRLTYHQPSLHASTREYSRPGEMSIMYWTWNTNPNYGQIGWVPMSTFGGRLTENIVQATAHDILRYAILNLRATGYPTVLHVYDEIVVEVPHGLGSLEEVERIASIMPPWARDAVGPWPVVATGGWRGRRYRKG